MDPIRGVFNDGSFDTKNSMYVNIMTFIFESQLRNLPALNVSSFAKVHIREIVVVRLFTKANTKKDF